MHRISDLFHVRPREEFGEGDHQEYVEPGFRDVFLIGGVAALMIGGFFLFAV